MFTDADVCTRCKVHVFVHIFMWYRRACVFVRDVDLYAYIQVRAHD